MALLTPNKARGSVFEHRLISSLPPDIQAQVLASSDVHGSIVQAIHSGKVDRLHEQLIACWQDLKNETTKSNDLASGNNTLVANVKDLMLKNMELSTNMTKMQEAFGAKQEEVKQLQTQALGQLALLRVQALVAQTFELYEYSIPRLFVVLLQDTSSQDPTNLFSNKFRLYFLCECGGHTKLTDPKNNKALEGSDLRKLETFLKNNGGNKVPGNLYLAVAHDGHVKWVCIDHYRENHQENAAKAFRDTVESMEGSFDENMGRVTIHLRSKTQADNLYQALERARSVFELDITLDWDTTQSDFKKLRDTLCISSIGALRIDLKRQGGPTSDILNRNKRHDPILDIMRHPSIHSIAIIEAPETFVQRSSLQSRNDDDFSNLRHLSIDLSSLKNDVPESKRWFPGHQTSHD
ncbi:hypothetical protein B0O80DRAFT_484969 [Mortierella sp. GBAus27b]|nr:hypothetical protein B0O80DRAFT_484969 [Mortierella sp. GBAus27b]